MDPNLAFWLYAYVLMFVVLVIGFQGIQRVKKGDFVGHMQKMTLACNLLLFFVVTYVVKVLVLGREDKTGWSAMQLAVLYVHESLILGMLVCGTYARILASKFKGEFANPSPDSIALRKRHAVWGKRAYFFAVAAFLTATGVLVVLGLHQS